MAAQSEAPAQARRARPTIRPLHPSVAGVLGIGAALWGFVAASASLTDNSLFTHLATGRLILEQGSIPDADPYSFTAPGAPWLIQSWLVSLVYGALDALLGPWAIRVAAGALGAGTAAGLWALTRPGRTLFSRLLAFVPGMLIGGLFWSARPLLVGYLGMVLVLLALARRWPPWVLLPIMWVWANSHGSFPLAAVLVVAVIVGRRLDGRDVREEAVRLGWLLGGIALAVVNPIGPRLLLFPLELADKTDILANVVEWASPDFSAVAPRLYLLQIGVTAVALLRVPAWRRAVPAFVFVALSLLSLRNVPVASLVLVWASAPGLAGIGDITGRERNGVVRGLAMVLVAVLLLMSVQVARDPAFDLDTYPVAATALLAAEGRLGGDERLLTSDQVGNFLELLQGDEARVFVDDRFDMYPADLLRNYLVVRDGHPGWQDVLEDCGISAVLLGRSEPLVQLLTADPAWRVDFTDDEVALLSRREPAPAIVEACTEA